MECWKLKISGKVQGVWYRRFVETNANLLGIKGWVQNEPDGSVTAVFEHNDVEVLEDLLFRCGKGPENARVDGIDVNHIEPVNCTHFEIRK